jgi:hypothetical protein
MKNLLICFFTLAISVSIYADDSSDGCGIGNMVYDKKSLFGTSIRSVTNYFLGITNLGATTSGTLGCAKHSIVKAEKRAIHFMEINYHNVLASMANGQGEHLQALARVMGCPEDLNNEFNQKLKDNFETIASDSDSPGKLLNSVKEVVGKDTKLASCHSTIKG